MPDRPGSMAATPQFAHPNNDRTRQILNDRLYQASNAALLTFVSTGSQPREPQQRREWLIGGLEVYASYSTAHAALSGSKHEATDEALARLIASLRTGIRDEQAWVAVVTTFDEELVGQDGQVSSGSFIMTLPDEQRAPAIEIFLAMRRLAAGEKIDTVAPETVTQAV